VASSTIFVSNFPFATTEEELRARFEELNAVRSVRIIVDRESGRSRGFAFVELEDVAAVDSVIEKLDGSEMKGRRLAVSRARGRGAAGEAAGPRPSRGREAADEATGIPGGPSTPFRHRIVIDWVEETSVYSAAVPELGVSAEGATIEAAVHAVRARAESESGAGGGAT
jgi:cold-inducible RNA-binding protein